MNIGSEYNKKFQNRLILILGLFLTFLILGIVIILVLGRKVFFPSKRSQFEKQVLKESFDKENNNEISPIIFPKHLRQSYREKYKNRPLIENSTIFVGIPSYRDPEIAKTLKDLYDKTIFRKRIFVGIFQQVNEKEDSEECFAENAKIPKKWFENHVRIKTVKHTDSKGPTWARHHLEKLWNEEEYVLLLDSHMRFEPAWDAELIEMLFQCRRPQRTVITMYPENFERIKNKDGSLKYVIDYRRNWRLEQLKFFNQDGILEFEALTDLSRRPKNPEYTVMIGACFYFGHSDIIRLVPFQSDTPFLFFGEELFLTARLWTHGFDIVGPTHSVVYHLWVREYRKTFWDHNNDQIRKESLQHILNILKEKIKNTKYGLGKVRSISEFWNYVGVNFENKTFIRKKNPWKPSFVIELQDKYLLNANVNMINSLNYSS
jgi:[Skp1-protein]-hydroxyproline N-acetylglucosaminyltransferase